MMDIDLHNSIIKSMGRAVLRQCAAHHYRIEIPGNGRLDSTDLIECAGVAIITGDVSPCANGAISALGYDLRWFANATCQHYLCSKFLRKDYQPELARKQYAEDLAAEGLEDDSTGDMFEYPNSAYEAYEAADLEPPSNLGMDYDPRDAAILCGIQAVFARLYHAAQADGRLAVQQ